MLSWNRLQRSAQFLTVVFLLVGSAGLVASDNSCHACHRSELQGGITHRAHGLGADPQGKQTTIGCTACHGPSDQHAVNPRLKPDRTFAIKEEDSVENDQACLGCHKGGTADHWLFSEHQQAGVGCHGCHSIHKETDPVQHRTEQFQVCTGCHQREAADQMKFSHHPMGEGHVQCTDCHAPHGGAMGNLVAASVNDTCYLCHAEKRGPFLFEHEPVQDDCTHCHLPHGSVNDSLLKTRQPLLCQQCHIASRHPGTLYDSGRLADRDINIIGQSCTNCHSQVHGGNQPESSTFRR
ncbi:DmsE family decaheme c-type cytochrome [Porticoccus sp.]